MPARNLGPSGGSVTWACSPGLPPAVIFPFTPAERYGARSLYEFQVLMYRPLYWFGSDGTLSLDEDLSLAEPPEWSPDGHTVTITIKPWRWSNGEPICADNVMFWMNMLVAKKQRFGGYVPGCIPDNLAVYRKVAEDTVSFAFDAAYSRNWVLFNQLSLITPMPRAWDRTAAGPANASGDLDDVQRVYTYLMAEQGPVVAETNEHRARWADSPIWSVVSGPWRLKSFGMDGTVVFTPNLSYSGPGLPYLDEFRQVTTASDEEELTLLRAGPRGPGSIQVGFLPPNFATGRAASPAEGGPNPLADDYRLVPQLAYGIKFLALNLNNPTVIGRILNQAYVRQALQSALDQDAAVRDIYNGYAYRTNGPVPAFHADDLVSPRQRGTSWPYPFDVKRAARLLADNGWDVTTTPGVCLRPGTGPGAAGEGIPAGSRLSFRLRYAAGRPALARLMTKFAENAGEAGIELRLEEVSASVLIAEDAPCVPGPDNACLWELACWGGGWLYDYPTGENLFQSGSACNFSTYSDPRADELIARTLRTDDLDALYEYQDYIAEQVPVIFLPNLPFRLFEVANDLRGFEPINPRGLINPERWYFASEPGRS